jgi:hypothetical protein
VLGYNPRNRLADPLDGLRKGELSVKTFFNYIVIALGPLRGINAQIGQFAGIQPQKLLSFWLII